MAGSYFLVGRTWPRSCAHEVGRLALPSHMRGSSTALDMQAGIPLVPRLGTFASWGHTPDEVPGLRVLSRDAGLVSSCLPAGASDGRAASGPGNHPNDEGNRLLRIVRRSSGSVVTWRRAQMVLLSAQGVDTVQIAEVTFTSVDRVRDVIHNFNADGFDSAGGR